MRKAYLESIANILSDFRQGELATPTPEHVDRWISQFDTAVQLPMLKEMTYVLQKTYYSRTRVSNFFRDLIHQENLVGKNHCDFWKTAHILNVQQNGRSQFEIRNLFGSLLLDECGLDINLCGSEDGPYVYLDDVLFSGERVIKDLTQWISSAPANATVHIIVISAHKMGEYWCRERLKRVAENNNKNISFTVWAAIRPENRKSYKDSSDVLWPSVLPEHDLVSAYIASDTNFSFEPRQSGTFVSKFFSSEVGRQLLETQFLLAGLKIISFCKSPNSIMKPLGFSRFEFGFGSTIVTYRNCPNNSPLALWWGDPQKPPIHPLGRWYPLVQRKTYETGRGDSDE